MGGYSTYRYKPTKALAKVGVKPSWGYKVPGGGAATGYATEAEAAEAMRKHSASNARFSSKARGMKMHSAKQRAVARVVGGRAVTF